MNITKGSWDALIAGQAIERMGWRIRMKKMAAQIEKLSFLYEYEVDAFNEFYKDEANIDASLEKMKEERMEFLEGVMWPEEQARRAT